MYLNKQWTNILSEELKKEYFIELQKFIENEYKTEQIFPKYEDIFRAFNLVDIEKLKVVIIGQDPYHGTSQANGLAFSVNNNCKIPPSLKNIYKELVDDIGCSIPKNGDLSSWAKQGVLLFNTIFTVVEGKANSHKDKGWELFSDGVIKSISEKREGIAFILWGSQAQKKIFLIDKTKHLIIKSVHPSPLSSYRGFFGSKPFSKVNTYLNSIAKKEISWCLPSEQTLL